MPRKQFPNAFVRSSTFEANHEQSHALGKPVSSSKRQCSSYSATEDTTEESPTKRLASTSGHYERHQFATGSTFGSSISLYKRRHYLPRSASTFNSATEDCHGSSILHIANDALVLFLAPQIAHGSTETVRHSVRCSRTQYPARDIAPLITHGSNIQSIWQRSPMIRLASTLPFINRSALSGHQRSSLERRNASSPAETSIQTIGQYASATTNDPNIFLEVLVPPTAQIAHGNSSLFRESPSKQSPRSAGALSSAAETSIQLASICLQFDTRSPFTTMPVLGDSPIAICK